MCRIIGHTDRCRVDFAKLVAPKFSPYALNLSICQPLLSLSPTEKVVTWTFLLSTCAIRIMYRRVEGRSLSKVDTFSFHRRHQCALQMPVGRSLRAGGLQNLKINCHTSEGLLNPAEQHLAAMESEIHLPYRPVTRNRGDWLQSAAMHISRMPAAVTGVLRNPELVAAGGLPRMSEVCRCDKCFSRTVNGAGTVSCARRVIYTVAPSAIASKLASIPASAYI